VVESRGSARKLALDACPMYIGITHCSRNFYGTPTKDVIDFLRLFADFGEDFRSIVGESRSLALLVDLFLSLSPGG